MKPVKSGKDVVLTVSGLTATVSGQRLLDDVSFEVRKGMTLAIVGPNGAGKSTLFRALMNFIPHTGKIEWMEKVKIGYVPQKISIGDIPISVKEFLSFKKSSGVEECVTAVGLDAKSVLDKRLNVLSGGELQRVFVVWALIDEPNVLLFDEPITGVDIHGEEVIYELLDNLQEERNITILMISHDIHLIRDYSDYMLALNRHVVFFGESKRITDPSLLQTIYGSGTILNEPRRGQ